MPTAPKSAMNPASVCAHPMVGQSQSCVPCFSACTGHTGALSCKRAVRPCPRASELASHDERRRHDGDRHDVPREGNRGNQARAIAYELHDQPLWSSRMSTAVKLMRSIFLVATLAIGATSKTHAQTSPNAWHWNVNGNIFAGVNYQHRKASDITEVESQNWLMAMGERPLGTWPAARPHDVLVRAIYARRTSARRRSFRPVKPSTTHR